MCGIIGIVGTEPVADRLIDSLKRLEYRGYDSAGIAALQGGHISRRRAEGKLRNLEEVLRQTPLESRIGIGHTRWATHGRPSVANAHPHATTEVAVVHNGIIENFRQQHDELLASGANFESETDTEVVAHLVTRELRAGLSPTDAVAAALPRLQGAFALAFLFDGDEDLLIGARKGSPLAIGYGKGEMYLGSDAIALAPFTDTIAYLEDGDWAVLRAKGIEIRDCANHRVERAVQKTTATAFLIEKGAFRH
ncbi:MAG: glutamine--fructose-6-phosphate aminotransferase, partial [Starkeya sp.]|nr:glutamine--fructose-6-phosphate aminotransferase [Starkeya sp.]